MASIWQINISTGGLPKQSVLSVNVSSLGLEGDVNRYRLSKKDNTPDQAILVIPKEHIEALAREGWPLAPGLLGENFTTVGIAYHDLKVGEIFRVGPEVEIQISKPCAPCANLKPYGEGIVKALVDRRGWYARVLKPGKVSVRDPVVKVAVGGA